MVLYSKFTYGSKFSEEKGLEICFLVLGTCHSDHHHLHERGWCRLHGGGARKCWRPVSTNVFEKSDSSKKEYSGGITRYMNTPSSEIWFCEEYTSREISSIHTSTECKNLTTNGKAITMKNVLKRK